MNYISSFLPASFTEAGVAAAAGWMGRQFMQNAAYQYAPAFISNTVSNAAYLALGSIGGSFVAAPLASIAVVQAMPYVLMGANVAGTYLGYQAGRVGYHGAKLIGETAVKTYNYVAEQMNGTAEELEQHEENNKQWHADVTDRKLEDLSCQPLLNFKIKEFLPASAAAA